VLRRFSLSVSPRFLWGWIELGRVNGKVEGSHFHAFGCEMAAHFHRRHVFRGPLCYKVRFEVLGFSSIGLSLCLRPTVVDPASGATHFRGHFRVHFRYGPMARRHPKKDDLVNRFQRFSFLPPCFQDTRLLTFASVGLTSH
jgi:hypothetical protein